MGYDNLKPALERIKMVSGFIAGHGQDIPTVFALEDTYFDTPQMKVAVERMKAESGMGRLIAEGYLTADYNLDELIKYPPGSLGRTYARLMQLHGFKAHFYPDREIKTDADYCIMRVRKTHDIHHAVTGFSMKPSGEAGVIGVTAYQYGYPAFVLIDLAGMALTFMQAQGFQSQFTDVCAPLLGIKWEEGWEKPLSRWREELKITPVTNGEASWYDMPGMWA